MDCPKCDAKAHCRDTRRRKDHTTVRRYACVNGHRWSTLEVVCRVGRGTEKMPSGRPGNTRFMEDLVQQRTGNPLIAQLLDGIEQFEVEP